MVQTTKEESPLVPTMAPVSSKLSTQEVVSKHPLGVFQDTNCAGWKKLLFLIDEAAADGREVFSPREDMTEEEWADIVTLPPSIAKLTEVKQLILYGSNLQWIPPEIGQMSSLEEFMPYSSYHLHWFPYEITQCARLKKSTVSTRTLYGNSKTNLPFPSLPYTVSQLCPSCCSVCARSLEPQRKIHQAWISRWVATDVMPLLVHACSKACLSKAKADTTFSRPGDSVWRRDEKETSESSSSSESST